MGTGPGMGPVQPGRLHWGGRGRGPVSLAPRPQPTPWAVWLVSSTASPKVHIYSCFYAMLGHKAPLFSTGCTNKSNQTTAQTKRAKRNHVHAPAWHQPCAPPCPARPPGHGSQGAGWGQEAAERAQSVPTTSTPGLSQRHPSRAGAEPGETGRCGHGGGAAHTCLT